MAAANFKLAGCCWVSV